MRKLTLMVEQGIEQIQDRFGIPTVMVVIDTVIVAAAYAKSGDENDAGIAQRIMSVLSALSKKTEILVVGIDHFGKVSETGTRGSSAKESHADAVLALLADRELNGTLTNTRLAVRKLREGNAGLEIPFTPKTVEVGTDADGDPITRVVIDWEPAASEQTTPKGWPKSQKLLRRILMTQLADGEDVQPFLNGPIVRACRIDQVRDEFYRQYPAEGSPREKTETRRKAFQRAIKSAHQDSAAIMIREIGGTQFVWLAKNETE